MSCNLDQIKEDSLQQVKKTFLGNSTSFTEKGPYTLFASPGKYDIYQLLKIVGTATKRVEQWALETFKNQKFTKGWVDYTQFSDGVEVNFKFPTSLAKAYEVKKEDLSLDNANNELFQEESRDLDYFNNDEALYEQERREDLFYDIQIKEGIEDVNNNSQSNYLQQQPGRSIASEETISKVKEILGKMGVDVIGLSEYAQKHGIKDYRINALADLTNKIIAVAEGKEGVSLTEEMVHIATAIINQVEPSLVTRMISKINNFQIYKKTFDQYKNVYTLPDGKPDIRAIKKEAVDKLIAEIIIRKANGESLDFPELSIEENRTMIEKWWEAILDFFRRYYRKSDIDIFQDVATRIMNEEFTGPFDSDGSYYQLSEEQESLLEKFTRDRELIEKREAEPSIKANEDPDETNYYVAFKEGTWQKIGRVTDRIKKFYEARFKDKKFTEEEEARFEFLRKTGTRLHTYFEDIHAKYYNEDGSRKNNPSRSQLKLSPFELEFYKKLEKYFVELMDAHTIDGKAPMMLSEQIVYDPNANKGEGEAGTLDLLIVDSNNVAHIYDWKFTAISKDQEDIAWYKQQAFDKQIGRYKEILRDVYGIKEFGKMRAIPVAMEVWKNQVGKGYTLKGIRIGSVNPKNIEPLIITPVSESTESTGDAQLDNMIEQLNSLHKRIDNLEVKGEDEKWAKARKLNALSKGIRAARASKNVVPILEIVREYSIEADSIVSDYVSTYKESDGDNFSDVQLSKFADRIREYMETSTFFENIQDKISHLIYDPSMDGEAKTNEEKALLAARKDAIIGLTEATKNIRLRKDTIKSLAEEFADKYIGERNNFWGLLSPEAVWKGLTSTFTKTSDVPLTSVQILAKLTTLAKDRALRHANTEVNKIMDIRKRMMDKGVDVRSYVKAIYQKDKDNKFVNKLIYKFDKKFYDEIKTIGQNADINWIYQNINVPEYLKEANAKYKERVAQIKNKYAGHEDIIKKLIEDERKTYDINFDGFNGWNNYILKRHPAEKWLSEEYKEIQKDPLLLELYNYIESINNKASEIGYIDNGLRATFLPFVRRSSIEGMMWGGANLSVLNNWWDSLKVNADDVGYGNIDEVTKEVVHSLPKYYTHDFTKDGNTDFSEDLFKNLILYTGQVYKYDELSRVEGQIKIVQTVDKFKNHYATGRFGNIIKDENGEFEIQAGNEENAKTFDTFLRGVFYEEKYPISDQDVPLSTSTSNAIKKMINKVAKKEIFKVEDKPSAISMVKAMDNLNKIFQLKTLGLDPIVGIVASFGNNIQLNLQSGNYFKYREVAKNQAKFVLNKMFQNKEEWNKYDQLRELFMPLKDSPVYDKMLKSGLSKFTDIEPSRVLMATMAAPEMATENAIFITLLENMMVNDQGKIVSIPEFVKSKYKGRYGDYNRFAKTISEEIEQLKKESSIFATSTIGEDGNLQIPNLDLSNISEIQRLSLLSKRIVRNATGNMSDVERTKTSMNIIFNSAMVFKNWIPPLLNTRFGAIRRVSDDFSVYVDENGLTQGEKYEIGRMRVWSYVMLNQLRTGSLDILNILQANENGVLAMDKLYEKYASEYTNRTGKEFNMDKEEFYDMIRTSLRNQTKEVLITLSLISLLFSAGLFEPDDDEDRAAKNAFRYTMKILDKLVSEVTFFYDITEFDRMLTKGGLIPSLGLFTDIAKFATETAKEITGMDISNLDHDPEKVRKDAHPVKYFYKMMPVTKVLSAYAASVSDEFARENDITIQAEH